MEHKKKLEELNKQSLHKLEEYMKEKEIVLKEDDHKKLHSAKEEWQLAWNKLMEALLVLERIEIRPFHNEKIKNNPCQIIVDKGFLI